MCEAGGDDGDCEGGSDNSGDGRSGESSGGEGINDRDGRNDDDEGVGGDGDHGSNGGNDGSGRGGDDGGDNGSGGEDEGGNDGGEMVVVMMPLVKVDGEVDSSTPLGPGFLNPILAHISHSELCPNPWTIRQSPPTLPTTSVVTSQE